MPCGCFFQNDRSLELNHKLIFSILPSKLDTIVATLFCLQCQLVWPCGYETMAKHPFDKTTFHWNIWFVGGYEQNCMMKCVKKKKKVLMSYVALFTSTLNMLERLQSEVSQGLITAKHETESFSWTWRQNKSNKRHHSVKPSHDDHIFFLLRPPAVPRRSWPITGGVGSCCLLACTWATWSCVHLWSRSEHWCPRNSPTSSVTPKFGTTAMCPGECAI